MHLKHTVLLICTLLIKVTLVHAKESIDIPNEDKIRIKEAMQIAEKFSDSVWPGFSKIPFTMILITDEHEFLIDHPNPSNDFTFLKKDEILQLDIFYRKQQYNKGLLATFPAVNGVNCIVIGTPKNTGLNSTEWIITLLHEHFHQYQYNAPNYHQDALKLGLSNGDETGMWQLNYPFPYGDRNVIRAYESYTAQLAKTLENLDGKSFQKQHKKLLQKRKGLEKTLSTNDYKYLQFQWYQEGVARFTEHAFLRLLAASGYAPMEEIGFLDDFIPYDIYLKEFYKKHVNNITHLDLHSSKRVTVYDVGFAESLIIQKTNPNWTHDYLDHKFDLRKFQQMQ